MPDRIARPILITILAIIAITALTQFAIATYPGDRCANLTSHELEACQDF